MILPCSCFKKIYATYQALVVARNSSLLPFTQRVSLEAFFKKQQQQDRLNFGFKKLQVNFLEKFSIFHLKLNIVTCLISIPQINDKIPSKIYIPKVTYS